MAEPVYDEDKDQDLDSLSPHAIRDLEDKYSQGVDETEDNLAEAGYNPDDLTNKGTGRKLRKRSEKEDAEKEEALNQQLRDTWKESRAADLAQRENQVGRGYRPTKAKGGGRNFWQRWRRRRKLLAGASLLVSGLAIGLIFLFGFLNVFKLDDMMSNIDAKTFARFNAAADRRSDKWIQSYLFVRLMQLRGESGADPDSEYFRANRVDTNNPIRDWYHTLRTSSFEADLAKKGIVFANRDAGNGIKFSVLEVNGKEIAGLKPGDVRSGNLVDKLRTDSSFVQSKLAEVDLNKPGANRDARRLIKNVVNDNIRFTQVIKRRQVRKDIQNLTGVRDWRFFEKTRDKVDQKKNAIRNKLVTKAIPESTLAGKFIRCFFGISDCRYSNDPSDPQYESDTTLADEGRTKQNQPDTDRNGKPVGTVDLGPAADIVKQIIGHLNLTLSAVNVVQTLDSLSSINKAILTHQLSKGVSIARGVQAMGLYQVFETSRDQIKSGQVTADEVNKFMQILGPVSNGEGWTKVLSGEGDASKLTDTAASKKYCSEKNQAAIENNPAEGGKQFAYLCPDKQIGGPSTASRLEDDYKHSIGEVLGPVLSKYDEIRHAPVIGAFADFLSGIVNTISGVISGLVQDLLKAVGLEDNLQNAMAWFIQKVSAFLGAGPILNGNESAAVLMNWLVQGGAFTAEAVARANGAMATTPATKVTAATTTAQYLATKNSQMSVFDKYLSLSNPDSPAAQTAFALSETSGPTLSNKLFNFGAIFKTIGSALTLPFNKHSFAQSTNDPYRGADFAAVQTQDFPQQCYDREPLFQTPQDGTNIQEVLGKDKVPDNDLTWDLVDNNNDWYKYVYDKIGDRADTDTVAEKIYNCNLLDTSVRGGTGNVYGYTDDNGLDDNSPSLASDSSQTPGSVNGLVNPLSKVSNLAKGRVDQGVDYSGSGPILAIGSGKILNTTNSGWPGGTFIVIKLDNYPDKYVYVAENCQNIKVHTTQHVNAGDELCTLVNVDPNLEIGWADGSAIGAALAHDVWVGNDDPAYYTAYGENFSQLLQKLGAPPGTIQAGAKKLGALPSGWPSWQ